MELSRLSNSLGSVCSQRRGRLAAVAGRPRLPRSLSHHSPPLPSLRSHWSIFFFFFMPVFLSRCAREIPPAADPARLFRLLVPNAAPGLCDIGPTTVRVLKLTVAHHTMALSQQDFGLRPFLPSPLSSTSPKPPT